jgi:hypothetical protein
LGSHKNTLTLTKKRYASKTITNSQPPAINTDKTILSSSEYRVVRREYYLVIKNGNAVTGDRFLEF